MQIRPIENRALEKVYPLMRQLRRELSLSDFISIYAAAEKHDNYRLVGLYEGQNCNALMGYRTLYDFVHGKHLYIDDLVVDEACRSKGYGAKLLEFAETECVRLECTQLRLCTGIDNIGGKNFYEREGWAFRSVVYKKKPLLP